MCLHPIHAWWSKVPVNGSLHIHFTPPTECERFFTDYIPLPCGKCIGCLDDRRKIWINRLLLEFDNSKCGSFVTLTYNENHVPLHPMKEHVQKFLKRFRNIPRDFGFPPFPPSFKYFFCGESGGKKGRPHYHALLFGADLLAEIWKPYIATYDEAGNPVFSSKVLETKWPFGFCTVDTITAGRCKYIAKYTMKQVGQEHSFTLKSPRLGVSEFFNVQRKGRKVFYTYRSKDSYDRLFNGTIHISDECGKLRKIRIPSSIVKYLEKIDEDLYLELKYLRQVQGENYAKNFDMKAYEARLLDENKKEKLKRRLHK